MVGEDDFIEIRRESLVFTPHNYKKVWNNYT